MQKKQNSRKGRITALRNNPLLMSQISDEWGSVLDRKLKNKNLFIGIGIVTQNKISQDLPFDLLGFLLSAEHIRQIFGMNKIIIFVADRHALENNLAPKSEIKKKAKNIINKLSKIFNNLDLKKPMIIQTTALDSVESIKKIFRSLPNIKNGYLKHEIADVQWLEKHHNISLKLGWSLGNSLVATGHDERFFDQEIKKFGSEVEFLHLKPGRTFSDLRPRVSPYISLEGEDRILLKKNEKVDKKINNFKTKCSEPNFKATLRHLSHIVRAHHKIAEPIREKMNLANKIQIIIDQVTK